MWGETRPCHTTQQRDDVDGLWGRGGASITVPCLILSSTTGLGEHPLVPAHAKLCCPGCSRRSHPAWEAAEVGRGCMMEHEEPGFGQAAPCGIPSWGS